MNAASSATLAIAGTPTGIATAQASVLIGLEAHPIRVEVSCTRGPSQFQMVGLAEAAVRESKVRVQGALAQLGVLIDEYAITVNLAPADLRKSGAALDVAIALAVLGAVHQLDTEALQGVLLIGELSLDGSLRPVTGVLPRLEGAERRGIRTAIVPRSNSAEAGLARGVKVLVADTLEQVVQHLRGRRPLPVAPATLFAPQTCSNLGDLSEVRGQATARRALEMAAAGGHNLLFVGPPGSGKTLLARLMPTILPPLELEEAVECTAIHSVAGTLPSDTGIVTQRPFRAPHHSVSEAGLVGGGDVPRPGEVSLAHHGVLFLDELAEFRRSALEALRQPLEDGKVCIARARARAWFPARPVLVAAVNPCPCGFRYWPPRATRAVQRCNMALATFECTRLAAPAAKGGPQTGRGSVEVTDHGRVSINLILPSALPPFGQPWLSEELRLDGETKDGFALTATRAYVEGTDWDSTAQEAVIRLASLDPVHLERQGGASSWTAKKLHLRNINALWPQSWSHAGLAFELRAMHRGNKLPERDRAGLVDYELTVQRSAQGHCDWLSVRSAVAKLLSLAARSPCSAPIEETWDGNALVEVQLQTGDFDFQATHTLIPLDCLGSFMGLALPEYLANEADASLDTLVAHYCRSHTESMAEYKFLFAGVLMEALKFNWAVNRRKLPVKRAASGVIKDFLKPDGKSKYGFEELLNMVASDLGVNAKYTFIENRNTVFHTGQAAAAQTGGGGSVWPILKPELVKLHDEVDDLLLALLKYTGPITSYWNMGQRLQFPGRAPVP